MGVVAFEIQLDNSMGGVYFAGQVVQGRVHLVLNKQKEMRGVEVTFKGKAEVRWKETTGSGDNRRTKHYNSEEVYFDQTIYVFGSKHSTNHLQAGEHFLPFAYQLPYNLPSSYEHNIGHVRYYIKANIDLPMAFDKKVKRIFTINYVHDLNVDPRAGCPTRAYDEKKIGWFFNKTGKLSIDLNLIKTGYVPGEKIMLNCTIDNTSKQDMAGVKVKMYQVTQFFAKGKTREERFKAAKFTKGEIPGRTTDTWENQFLTVPSLPPSGLKFCNIINIDHYMTIEVDVPGISTNLSVSTPLVIGTIPLVAAFNSFIPSPNPVLPIQPSAPMMAPSAPMVPPSAPMMLPPDLPPSYPEANSKLPYPAGAASAAPNAPTCPTQQYSELPPPSYTDALGEDSEVTRGKDDDDTNANWDFRPKYMTYHSRDG